MVRVGGEWGGGVSLAGEARIPFLVPGQVLSCLTLNRRGATDAAVCASLHGWVEQSCPAGVKLNVAVSLF